MSDTEKQILAKFKALVLTRLRVHQMILFGSRARGDADPDSDMDVVVILADDWDWDERVFVSRCAWEAGFESGIIVVPVIFSREQWEDSPYRWSLLAQAVRSEGVPV